MENEKYDIEKLAESNNRKRKMSHDFDDDDDLGMDFSKLWKKFITKLTKTNKIIMIIRKIKLLRNFCSRGDDRGDGGDDR